MTDGNHTEKFLYDDHGNVVKSIDSTTGQAEYYAYNPDQQIYQVSYKAGNGLNLTYQHDADGRISKITNNLSGKSITFTYNSVGELTKETTWGGKTISYTYDNVGNRTSMSVTQNGTTTTTTYGYNTEKNRLTSITTGGTTHNVTHDPSGNTLTDGTNTYTWNAAGQLASVQVPNGTTYGYTYDGLGRRKTAYGDTYHYNGQSTQIAYITDSNNNLVARFSYGANRLPAYMTTGSGKVYRYVYDGQNDVVGLINVSTGNQVVSYSYDAWGNVTTTDTSATDIGTLNPFTYRGYVYDSQTGLYYLNARYYNPATGRFLSQDPVKPNASRALSMNGYVYAAADPVNRVDPTGQWFKWWQPWNSVNNIGTALDIGIQVAMWAFGFGGGLFALKEMVWRDAEGLFIQVT